jgi:hypothetical protein
MLGSLPFGAEYQDVDQDDLQFRLRFSPKQMSGRPRLLSIDYQMGLRIGVWSIKYTIAVLDVVFHRYPPRSGALIPVHGRPTLPVADLEWILEDLTETWETTPRAKQRIWAGKREKNEARYDELVGGAESGMSGVVDRLGVISRPFFEHLDIRSETTRDYLKVFDWAKDEEDKQVMPFYRSELDLWRHRMDLAQEF